MNARDHESRRQEAGPPVSPLRPPPGVPWWTRAVHVLAIPLAFVLPAWTSLGRVALAGNGTVTALFLVLVTPTLFLVLLAYAVLGLVRASRHPSGTFGSVSSGLVLAGWLGAVLAVVSFGDFDELDEATLAPLAQLGVPDALVTATGVLSAAALVVGVAGGLVAAVVELARTRGRSPSARGTGRR